jgi:M6 family metalloprotease-like protein
VSIPRAFVRSAAIVLALGSQALIQGLAPSVWAGPVRGLSAARPGTEAPARSPEARALAARRFQHWRSFPHRIGEASSRPFVTGGRRPLLAMKAGRLERTAFFTGAPETLRVLGLKIDFATDSLGPLTTTPDGKFDLSDGRSRGIVIDPPPHDRRFFLSHLEALRRYWKFASYGHLVIEYDVYPKADSSAYRLADTGRYGPWTLGQQSFDSAQRFFHDAVTAADQTDSIPFGRFDVVALFHSGSDFQTDLNNDSPRDFPTFQINLTDSVPVNGGAVSVRGGLVMPETESQDGYFAAINGTLAHEFGHTQGLFDLYDIETLLPGVGVWSNMDSGYLLGTSVTDAKTGATVNASGILPVSLDPWSKFLLWPDNIQYVDPGRSLSTSLRAAELSDTTLFVPMGGEEFYLIENRETDLNQDNTLFLDRDSTGVLLGPGLADSLGIDTVGDKEYDFLLPGQGVLIWHVDNSVIYGRHIPPDFGINSNPLRRGVRVMEADGIEDLGNPSSSFLFGSPFDPYFVGNHTRLGPETVPNSDTNDGGKSHTTIDVASPAGLVMNLSVSSDWRVDGWPVSTGVSQRGAKPTYGRLRHDGLTEVVTAVDSLIFAFTSHGEPYYTTGDSSVVAALPARIVGPVLFADSLFHRNPLAIHDPALVATAGDGGVHAFRAEPRDVGASDPLFGWPPALDAGSPAVLATTGPVLDPAGQVIVGGSDGRVFAIVPSDSITVAPRVDVVADTLRVGPTPVTAPASGNLAVGRFTGAGGYQVAWALRNGWIRIVDAVSKAPGSLNVRFRVQNPNFEPYLLGVDMDRKPDRDLELLVSDAKQNAIHCFRLDGTELPGWPIDVAGTLWGPIAAGDLDGDGYPEIFAMDKEGRVHRYNRNGVEPTGWPVSMTERYGPEARGGEGSPLVADVTGDGRAEAIVALDNGLVVALDKDAKTVSGWPLAIQGGASSTPALLSMNDADLTPDPPGLPWTHLVIGGDDDGALHAIQLPARADSALFGRDGVSARTPWAEYSGNRRRTSVLEDAFQGAVAQAPALEKGSVYCFPNPAHGPDIGLAYTLGQGVSSVVIRVLDPMGNEVRRLAGSSSPAQNVVRIPVRDLASGVYLVRVEVQGTGADNVVFGKFAVVK